MENGIWIYAQPQGERLADVSLELVGEGRRLADRLGCKLTACLLGDQVSHLTDGLIAAGADYILLIEDVGLRFYRPEIYGLVVEKLASRYRPQIFLFGATHLGKDLAAVVAARLEAGLTAHCIAFDLDESGRLLQMVPAFGGRCVFQSAGNPQMSTVAPGIFSKPEPDSGRRGEVVREAVVIPTEKLTRILEFKPAEQETASLVNAEVIVAGGAGVGGREGWAMVEELANVLGGATGATRPPVDEGWTGEDSMIGQSGKTVHPKLYITVGVSGDQLHLSGVGEPELFIAINKDRSANIFLHADYGIVDDYRRILPHIIEIFKE